MIDKAIVKAQETSKEIDKYLEQEWKDHKKGPNLLLLGAGESGKTTVLKQIQLAMGKEFSNEQKQSFKLSIYQNILDASHKLYKQAIERQIRIEDEIKERMNELMINRGMMADTTTDKLNELLSGIESKDALKSLLSDNELSSLLLSLIELLWSDTNIKQLAQHGNEFFLLECAPYFLDNLYRINTQDYLPTDEDILNCRQLTTKVTEMEYVDGSSKFMVYDFSGQKSKRFIWAPYFEVGINCILFVASIACYDQKLPKDEDELQTNRMTDTIQLFGELANHPLLKRSSIILFLNKMDLFESKISSSPIQNYFADYEKFPKLEGDTPVKHAKRYFKTKFLNESKNRNKEIYVHFTTGTDKKQMKFIVHAVKDTVLKLALRDMGL